MDDDDDALNHALAKAARFVLFHRSPLKRDDILQYAPPTRSSASDRTQFLNALQSYLIDTVAMKLVKVKARYFLVSTLPPRVRQLIMASDKDGDGEEEGGGGGGDEVKRRGMLVVVLAWIVAYQQPLPEQVLGTYVKSLGFDEVGVHGRLTHPELGPLETMLTTWVQQKYLEKTKTQEQTVYTWGHRAFVEVEPESIIEFITEMFGHDMNAALQRELGDMQKIQDDARNELLRSTQQGADANPV